MQQPFHLIVTRIGYSNPEPLQEFTNYTGYIPRRSDQIKIGKTVYRVEETRYTLENNMVECIELLVEFIRTLRN